MITGRGPGAPGVTSSVQFTRGRVAPGDPGDGAIDLGEIRRSEEIIDVLAARAATAAPLLSDPAVALLSVLAADVDARDAVPEALADALRGEALADALRGEALADAFRGAARHHRIAAVGSPLPAPAPGITTWARAAAAGALVAGAAGTTSVVAAGRLARGPASGPSRSGWASGRPGAPTAHPLTRGGPPRGSQPASNPRCTP